MNIEQLYDTSRTIATLIKHFSTPDGGNSEHIKFLVNRKNTYDGFLVLCECEKDEPIRKKNITKILASIIESDRLIINTLIDAVYTSHEKKAYQ